MNVDVTCKLALAFHVPPVNTGDLRMVHNNSGIDTQFWNSHSAQLKSIIVHIFP